ncbi:hypothetical protein [uncultured Desulfosarcina sp.]|uniref:hypothetical protein n=1 Tax=uncultured Desulfosarcina sp. TaxID=218289 RepID=UPI0037478F7A
MAAAKGIDGVIGKGMGRRMMAIIIAAEPLAGRDHFCINDLKAFRAGMFAGRPPFADCRWKNSTDLLIKSIGDEK